MNCISLEEVINAKSFFDLDGKYVYEVYTIDKDGKTIIFKYVCASSIAYVAYHARKRATHGTKIYDIPKGYCRGRAQCKNTHIDARIFDKISLCGDHLVHGKCRRLDIECRHLHIFERTKTSTQPPMQPPMQPPILPPIQPPMLPPIPPPILFPIPPPIQLPITNICGNCTNTETQDLNTNPPTFGSQSESCYSPDIIKEYLTGWSKHAIEDMQFTAQKKVDEFYSNAQCEINKAITEARKFKEQLEVEIRKADSDKKYYINKTETSYAEIRKLKEQLEDESRKAASNKEYYINKIDYLRKEIDRHNRYESEDRNWKKSKNY